jgi:hypothetical protein
MGIEKTPMQIWEQVLDDANWNQEVAMEMLSNLDGDDRCLANFAMVVSGRQPYIVEHTQVIEIPMDPSLIYLAGIIGGLTGLLAGILFF